MATATVLFNAEEYETCVLCLSKHDRTRPSFCQCKHCSKPLCFDCMREHHEELLQNVAQVSHQYNELHELLQKKQKMIVEETEKSIVNVNQHFDIYINELRDTQRKIIEEMERTKQDAQDDVVKIESDLRILGSEIQGLAKESFVQATKMNNLSRELEKIKHKLNAYQVTRTENLNKTKVPEFSIKFECSPVDAEKPQSSDTDPETKKICETNQQESSLNSNTLDIHDQCSVVHKDSIHESRKIGYLQHDDDDSRSSDNDSTGIQDSHINTSYSVDRMASDGRYILYTSYYDDEPDLIAYCLVKDDSGEADKYRDWKQSRIEDMIWWSSIRKFICATNDAIYTVEYVNRSFRIICVIRGKWSYTRVAANTHQLFAWLNFIENDFNGINIYSTQFEYIRTIDFNTRQIGSFIDASSSFCVTDSLIASICTRQQNNRDVFQVTFCDMDMNKLNSVPLGRYNSDIEIRTDGEDRFFITTGQCRFYIVHSDGTTRVINLEDNGAYIAVLDHQRVAVSNLRNSMEILTY